MDIGPEAALTGQQPTTNKQQTTRTVLQATEANGTSLASGSTQTKGPSATKQMGRGHSTLVSSTDCRKFSEGHSENINDFCA